MFQAARQGLAAFVCFNDPLHCRHSLLFGSAVLNERVNSGFLFALSAFGLWGLAPVFFKLVAEVNPFEVLAHRVVWSVLILALVVQWRGQWRQLRALEWLTLKRLFWSSLFVSTNWFLFIWGVANDQVLQTSLGYFINPLISVCFGLLFLGERFRPFQQLAVGLAFVGVINEIFVAGVMPWLSLMLALSFASYGLIRKQLSIDPILGLFLETVLLLPIALVYFVYLAIEGELYFGSSDVGVDVALVCSGFMTTIPLLLFAAATQRLPLSQIGLVQYLTPTMSFCLAIFLYNEPFKHAQLISFACIWLGLAIFTIDGLRSRRRAPPFN